MLTAREKHPVCLWSVNFDVSFIEVRKIVESYMKSPPYANITRKNNYKQYQSTWQIQSPHWEACTARTKWLAQISKLCKRHLLQGNITEEECSNDYKCTNCQEDHVAFSRSCGVYRREKEIMEVKYKNISFIDARKVVDNYMKVTSYTAITQREKPDRYNTLIEKLLKLKPSDWPKFLEQLKLYYAKINQPTLQTKPKETITNTPVATLQTNKSPNKTNTTKQRSLIRPPTSEINTGKRDSRKTSPKITKPSQKTLNTNQNKK